MSAKPVYMTDADAQILANVVRDAKRASVGKRAPRGVAPRLRQFPALFAARITGAAASGEYPFVEVTFYDGSWEDVTDGRDDDATFGNVEFAVPIGKRVMVLDYGGVYVIMPQWAVLEVSTVAATTT